MDNSNDNDPITVVEFCAGYGGLGLGIKRVLGKRMRLIGLCELEGFAQANLISKMEAGLMAQVPIWSNLLTFPYGKFRGLVDIAVAGIPCQPHSLAGKRKGGGDERFLFDDWLRGLEQMQPKYILIENVEGLLSSKMPDGTLCIAWTIERLEAMGYKATAGIFSAREVGAPHQRKRVFILAHRDGKRGQLSDWWRESAEQMPVSNGEERRAWPSRPGEPQHEWEPPRVVGNTQHDGSHQRGSQTRGTESCGEQGWMQESEGGSASMGDTDNQGCRRLDDEQGEVSSRETRGHLDRASSTMGNGNSINWSAPSEGWQHDSQARPASEELADNLRGRLPHATNEQRNSGTDDHAVIRTRTSESGGRQTQQPLGRDTDEPPGGMDYAELSVTCDNRTDELRLLGNGVVPATAERAFRTLLAELIP